MSVLPGASGADDVTSNGSASNEEKAEQSDTALASGSASNEAKAEQSDIIPAGGSASNEAERSDMVDDACQTASGSRALPESSPDVRGGSNSLGSSAGEVSIDTTGCSSRSIDAAGGQTKPKQKRRSDQMAYEAPTPSHADRRPRKQARVVGSTRNSPVKAPRDMSTEEQRSTEQEADEDLKERELKRLRQELEAEKGKNASLKQQLQTSNHTLEKARRYLSEKLIYMARWERDKARDHLTIEGSRLGKYRSLVSFANFGTWEGGFESETIEDMKEQHKLERASIDRMKRQSYKQEKKNRDKADNGDGDNGADDEGVPPGEDAATLREIASQRTAFLSKQESELKQREQKLKSDRALYLKQQMRLTSEENSNFRHYPLLHERYQLLNLIGKGGFSEVFKALDLQTMTNVAVKIHELDKNMTDPQRQSYIRRAMREYEIQKALKHARIVHLSDCFPISNMAFATVLELCEGDTLDAYMKKHGAVQEKDARGIIIQILSGLRYMNTNGRKVIHYDLKPGNLFFHCGEVKICDFGLSKIVNESYGETIELTSQGAGTYWYLPPECFEEGGIPKISNKVDVWSTGVIFFELLFNRRPFGHGQSQEALMRAAAAGNAFEVQIPPTPKITNEARELILRLLTVDREKRPDVLEAFDSPYLKNKELKKVGQSQFDEG